MRYQSYPTAGHHTWEVMMLKSPFVKIGSAGFAAVVGVILVVASVGAHQTHGSSQGSLKVFTGVTGSAGTDIEEDAAADAAAAAAEAQKEAAQKAAEQAAEAAAEAADNDNETGDTETETEAADTETETEAADTETKAPTTTTTETDTESKDSGD